MWCEHTAEGRLRLIQSFLQIIIMKGTHHAILLIHNAHKRQISFGFDCVGVAHTTQRGRNSKRKWNIRKTNTKVSWLKVVSETRSTNTHYTHVQTTSRRKKIDWQYYENTINIKSCTHIAYRCTFISCVVCASHGIALMLALIVEHHILARYRMTSNWYSIRQPTYHRAHAI